MAANDEPRGPDTSTAGAPTGVDAGAWEQLRREVEAETGMDFSGSRLARLQDAVRRVLAQQHGVHLAAFLASPQEHGAFFERLTAELTVGESYFFRNEHHFRALRERVIPQILQTNSQQREVRVWSAGCAGGEEPYSLAILLDQMLGDAGWRVSILATDLNPQFLERARCGVFRSWSFRHTEIHRDPQYFSQTDDVFSLTPKIRDRVRFAYLNLVKDVYPSPLTGTLGLDLILFRNVAIYLKREVTAAILARLRDALRPGGWLLLGETEVAMTPVAGFEAHRFDSATFFRKTSGRIGVLEDAPSADRLPEFRPSAPVAAMSSPWPPAIVHPPTKASEPPPEAAALTTWPEPFSWDRVGQCIVERRFDDAESMFMRVADRKQRARLCLRYVQMLLCVAEAARARRLLGTCLTDDPLLLEAHLLQASFAEESGDLGAAEAAYRRALYLDRNCAMTHFHLALIQQQRQNRAGGARSLRTMLSLLAGQDPHAPAPYGEGVCVGRLREMAEVLLADWEGGVQ